jgi:hypothetical protein
MRSTHRKSALILASAAAVTGLSIVAPSTAAASTTVAVGTSAASPQDPPPRACTPAHEEGRDWRWHDAPRGGHWDHRQWDDGHNGAWKHLWSEDQFCAADADPKP